MMRGISHNTLMTIFLQEMCLIMLLKIFFRGASYPTQFLRCPYGRLTPHSIENQWDVIILKCWFYNFLENVEVGLPMCLSTPYYQLVCFRYNETQKSSIITLYLFNTLYLTYTYRPNSLFDSQQRYINESISHASGLQKFNIMANWQCAWSFQKY